MEMIWPVEQRGRRHLWQWRWEVEVVERKDVGLADSGEEDRELVGDVGEVPVVETEERRRRKGREGRR